MSVNRDQALSKGTTTNFLTALVVNGALLGAEVSAFLILKQKLQRIYSLRSVFPPPDIIEPRDQDRFAAHITVTYVLTYHWLNWLCHVRDPVLGIIQGVLPPALLVGLFALLPLILRVIVALAWYECIPHYFLISVSIYKQFYFFLLIHGFLIVTLSSGITHAIQDIIENLTNTIQELVSQLPDTSVFFLTYTYLAGAGAVLLQLANLVLYFIKKWFLGRALCQAYGMIFLMPSICFSANFGIILPRLSLLAIIGFTYSVLSPLIMSCFILLGNSVSFMFSSPLGMFADFNFLVLSQVFDQWDEMETGGLYFPMAINNLFVGLYIEQICLACLFFLKASGSTRAAITQAVFMLIILGMTAFAHTFINHSYSMLIKYLSMSLAMQTMASIYEKQRKQSHQASLNESDNEMDLFSRMSESSALCSVRRQIKKLPKALPKALDTTLDTIKLGLVGESSTMQKYHEAVDSPKTSEDTITEATEMGIDGKAELYQIKSIDSTVSRVTHTSKVSKASKAASKKSKKSKKDKDEWIECPAFDATAPALMDHLDEDNDDVHTFDHPSIYVDQPWIWILKDQLELSMFLVKELQDAEVSASDLRAEIRKDGIVEVTRSLPNEEWTGGHDA
ncbi:hypothetical protein AN958_03353 [Leucoagaricus sp. SymC.cos]|nr:hypothetical protein AN958_03353 [Leucoagaricus sp. SymC.cos]